MSKRRKCKKCNVRNTSKAVCFFCIDNNAVCRYCHTKKHLTKDHIIPRSKGGKNNRSNYQSLCVSCNQCKGVLSDYEVADTLRDIAVRGVWYKWEQPFAVMLIRIRTLRKDFLQTVDKPKERAENDIIYS